MTEAPRAWKLWKLDRIRPYPNNARTHPPGQITLLASMLKRWGADQPIVVDEAGVILKGHGRLLAALEAGLRDFPVVQRRGLPEEEKKALRLADNQVALLSGWDADLIKGELTELKLAGFDIPFLGFPEIQLRGFGFQIGTEGLADPEAAPAPPARPVSRRGDLWILGDHRLLCGDATSKSDVGACLDGARPHLMVTDPPYGVEYDPAWRAEPGKLGAVDGSFLSTEGVRKGAVSNDARADWQPAYDLFPGDIAYVWHGALFSSVVENSLHASKFLTRAQIVWVKQHAPISRGDYHWRHECCWYMVRKGKTARWASDRKQNTVWEIANMNAFGGQVEDQKTDHGTQKPLECMKRPIENHSRAGDQVYEPFSGSGTTIIAAEMTKRRALAIEIDPAYVDVAVLRWQNFTGRLARLTSGETYAEVKANREQGNATRHSRKSVQGKDARGNGAKRPVRKGVHDGLAATRRKPAGKPPPVAGNP